MDDTKQSEQDLQPSIDLIEVDIVNPETDEKEIINVVKADVTARKQELIEDNVKVLKIEDGVHVEVERPTIKSYISRLLKVIEDQKNSDQFSQNTIEELTDSLFMAFKELRNFNHSCTEALMNAKKQDFDNPLRVLGGIMSHDMLNHSIGDLLNTFTYLDMKLFSVETIDDYHNILNVYDSRIREHWRALGSFFVSFDLLMNKSSDSPNVTLSDLIASFPNISDPDLFEFKSILVSNGINSDEIIINSIYEFVDIRTILLNAIEAKGMRYLKPKGFHNAEQITDSPIYVTFTETETSRIFTVTDDTPVYTDENGNNVVSWFESKEEQTEYSDRTGDLKLPPNKQELQNIYDTTEKTYIGNTEKGGMPLVARNMKVIDGSIELTKDLNLGTKSVVLTFPKNNPSAKANTQV